MLSSEQERSLRSAAPHKKVVAGAGSGKTRVLVAQVDQWLEEGVDPAEISVVTFTRRAAMEVRRRLPETGGRLAHLGTITGFAFRRLFEAGIRFTVIDTFDLELVIRYVVSLGKRASQCRENVVARLVLHADYGNETESDRAIAKLVLGYMARHCLIHVSQVLGRFVQFLSDGGVLRAGSWRAARRVAWDEFQDSSDLELRLLQQLGPDYSLLIGDPRQSIYKWRGAVPENIEKAPGDTYELTRNYRSGGEIVQYCNSLPVAHGYRHLRPMRLEQGRIIRPIHVQAETFYPWVVKTFGPTTVLCRTNREIACLERTLKEETDIRVAVVAALFDQYTTQPWRNLYIAARLVLDPGNEWLQLSCPLTGLGKYRAGTPIETLAAVVDKRLLGDQNLTGSILDWLEWYSFRDVQDQIPSEEERPDILLMTVHGAKGLEWSTVVLHNADTLEGTKKPEEGNILYVAASRAMDTLLLFPTEAR